MFHSLLVNNVRELMRNHNNNNNNNSNNNNKNNDNNFAFQNYTLA